MTATPRQIVPSLRSRVLVAGALVMMIVGCETPPAGPVDYSDTYRIEPVPTSYVLKTKFQSGTGKLAIGDEGRFNRFMRQYLRRGRSSLVVATTPDSAGTEAQEHMAEFQRRLSWEGVAAKYIEVRPGTAKLGGGTSVHISFRGYEAKVPAKCATWTGEAGYNPTNLPGEGFGCSYQRNVGLMLSDPGDLVQSREKDSIDAQRTDMVIRNYRAGAPTPAMAPDSDAPALSDIGG